MSSTLPGMKATVVPKQEGNRGRPYTRLNAFLPFSCRNRPGNAEWHPRTFFKRMLRRYRNKTAARERPLAQSIRRMTTADAGHASRNSIEH
jgi:hypothetical protein